MPCVYFQVLNKTTPNKDKDDLDSSIIPDTPEPDSSVLEKRKRPLKSSRSFLSSSSFLSKSHLGKNECLLVSAYQIRLCKSSD